MIIKEGQVAVVTGAAQGLGRALVAGLIDFGMSVVLADTATQRLHTTAEEFSTRGAEVLPVITDVADVTAVQALARRTIDHFGRVDMVINNASITTGKFQPLWHSDPQNWQRVLAVNVLGVVYGVQAFVPYLVKAGTGHVVNIASLAGLSAAPFSGAYCASKHAVVAISEALRGELEMMGLQIGVTVVCPGLMRTSQTEGLLTLAQADDDTAAEQLPADLPREQRQQLQATLQGMITTIMEPSVAAERILAAVQTNRFYALTHGDLRNGARHRAEGILAALHDEY